MKCTRVLSNGSFESELWEAAEQIRLTTCLCAHGISSNQVAQVSFGMTGHS